VLLVRVPLHEEDERVGQIVHVQELAAGGAGAPDLDRGAPLVFAACIFRISAGMTWLACAS